LFRRGILEKTNLKQATRYFPSSIRGRGNSRGIFLNSLQSFVVAFPNDHLPYGRVTGWFKAAASAREYDLLGCYSARMRGISGAETPMLTRLSATA
jgi:hypothetical protein